MCLKILKNIHCFKLCLKILKIYIVFKIKKYIHFFLILNTCSTLKNIKKLFNKTSLNLKEVFDAAWKATACSDWVIFVLVVHPLPLISFCGNADCPPSQ